MTTECEQMREMMSELLDNRPGAAARRRLQDHLDGCRACRREWDALRAVDELLTGAAMASPAPGFAGRFQTRLAARRKRRQALIGLVLLSIMTAILLLVGVGSLAASGLWAWTGTSASAPGLMGHVVDSLSALGRAAENMVNLVIVILRALSRVFGHPYFLSSASVILLLAGVWAWIVAVRPRAYRAVRA